MLSSNANANELRRKRESDSCQAISKMVQKNQRHNQNLSVTHLQSICNVACHGGKIMG